MDKTPQILTALLAILLIGFSALQCMKTIAIYSDLAAFQARVAKSGNSSILEFGGESAHQSFDDLATKVQEMAEPWFIVAFAGILLLILQGMYIPLRKRKNSEPEPGEVREASSRPSG